MRTIYSNYARSLTALMLAAMTALLASCGGSGLPPTTATATATSAAVVQLVVSSAQMPSSGATTVTVSAVILNATGQTVPGQVVSFSTNNDPSAYLSGVSAATDTNGLATATLNLGSNKSNRTISITATAGTAVGSNSVTVTGSTIAISGTSSLTTGGNTILTFSVKDSAGAAISGMPITLTSRAGNSISPASGTTVNGQFTATVTASTAAATDVITASAAGAVQTLNLSINSSLFSFTAPAANKLIPINTFEPISLTWSNGGAPVAASSVTFSSSRGTLAASGVAVTDGAGVAATTINSNSTGSTIISAAGPGGSPAASINVTFYTNTASSVSVQANPGTVAVTTGATGQTSNSSIISVVVRDASNNLVQNAQVNFSDTTDVTGGYLSSATATTDGSGSASVNYIAGGVSSPQNGVTITATVVSINGTAITPVSGTVNLTVSGQSLLVRLGTDNLVASIPPMNQKIYVATVTDAAGTAVSGVTVSFKLRPNRYFKGQYGWATSWVQTVSTPCAQEDNGGTMIPAATYAFNGMLDAGEDVNGNKQLDPGNATATITASAVTNAFGYATATITYSKDHATWAEFIIEARAGVNSNDPPATATYVLTGLASDYSSQTAPPPGLISPYGIAAVCTNPN